MAAPEESSMADAEKLIVAINELVSRRIEPSYRRVRAATTRTRALVLFLKVFVYVPAVVEGVITAAYYEAGWSQATLLILISGGTLANVFLNELKLTTLYSAREVARRRLKRLIEDGEQKVVLREGDAEALEQVYVDLLMNYQLIERELSNISVKAVVSAKMGDTEVIDQPVTIMSGRTRKPGNTGDGRTVLRSEYHRDEGSESGKDSP